MKPNLVSKARQWEGCAVELFVDAGAPHMAGHPNIPDYRFYRGRIAHVEADRATVLMQLRDMRVYEHLRHDWKPMPEQGDWVLDLLSEKASILPPQVAGVTTLALSADRELDIYDDKTPLPDEPREHLDLIDRLLQGK